MKGHTSTTVVPMSLDVLYDCIKDRIPKEITKRGLLGAAIGPELFSRTVSLVLTHTDNKPAPDTTDLEVDEHGDLVWRTVPHLRDTFDCGAYRWDGQTKQLRYRDTHGLYGVVGASARDDIHRLILSHRERLDHPARKKQLKEIVTDEDGDLVWRSNKVDGSEQCGKYTYLRHSRTLTYAAPEGIEVLDMQLVRAEVDEAVLKYAYSRAASVAELTLEPTPPAPTVESLLKRIEKLERASDGR